MNEGLLTFHAHAVAGVTRDLRRYLFDRLDWNARSLCVTGARGVGKTTLLIQHYLDRYNDPRRCLYLSCDNIRVVSDGLLTVVRDHFSYGGEAVILDEVHKYPDWSQEVKNILDTYKDRRVLLSGSSTLDLTKARHDLSRRVAYHSLAGLSFREYLRFRHGVEREPLSLDQVLKDHVAVATALAPSMPVLKYFSEYLAEGYYPYFLEGSADYLNKVLGSIEKVLYEDIAVSFNLTQPKIPVLKKLLWLIASSHPFVPNMDGIASDLGVSRPFVYTALDILEMAGLLITARPDATGARSVRKPGKVYFENTNLQQAIVGSMRAGAEIGTVRETFFFNQMRMAHRVGLHPSADFIVDGKHLFEIGGPSKKGEPVRGEKNGYLAIDGIEVGVGNRIPLWLFGMMY